MTEQPTTTHTYDPKPLAHTEFKYGDATLFEGVPIRFKIEIESEQGVFKLEMGPKQANWVEAAMAQAQSGQGAAPRRPRAVR
jgi:hypothetical protein